MQYGGAHMWAAFPLGFQGVEKILQTTNGSQAAASRAQANGFRTMIGVNTEPGVGDWERSS